MEARYLKRHLQCEVFDLSALVRFVVDCVGRQGTPVDNIYRSEHNWDVSPAVLMSSGFALQSQSIYREATTDLNIVQPNFVPYMLGLMSQQRYPRGILGAHQDMGSEGRTNVQAHSVRTCQYVAMNMLR